MHDLNTLSAMQLLSIWTDLEEARAGTNGFGGDVAEIYLYRAVPDEPSAEAILAFSPERAAVAYRHASESLLRLFQTFEKLRHVSIGVEDDKPRSFRPIGPWFVERDFRHRVHVHVSSAETWKWGIMHPSDRHLGRNFDGKEVWGGEGPILFDTAKEARAHVAMRSKEFPNSDWPQARVLRCRPGRPRTYAQWDWKTEEDATQAVGDTP
jgi:hypothetical protein